MPRDYFATRCIEITICDDGKMWLWARIIDWTTRISACSRCVKRLKGCLQCRGTMHKLDIAESVEREREWRMVKARDNEYSCDVLRCHSTLKIAFVNFLNEAYHWDMYKMNVLHTCILKNAWSLERFLHGSSTWKIVQHCPTLITLNILDTRVLSWFLNSFQNCH